MQGAGGTGGIEKPIGILYKIDKTPRPLDGAFFLKRQVPAFLEQKQGNAYFTATASTSTRAPMGRAPTWKQERAGTSPLKYSA